MLKKVVKKLVENLCKKSLECPIKTAVKRNKIGTFAHL